MSTSPTKANHLRVLHVSQPTEAGVPAVVLTLLEHQRALGWDVWVACPPGSGLASRAAERGATVLPWTARRSPGPTTLAEVASLRRVISGAKPGLVHLHSAKAGLAGRLAIRGRLPTVFSPHAWSFLATRAPLEAVATTWERAGARWTDRIVCVSADERDIGRRAGVTARWAVVPNGVAVSEWARWRGQREPAREQLGVPQGVPLVVCVGRLCEQKGQDVLLDAWSSVRGRVPGALLRLVGDGQRPGGLSAQEAAGVALTGDTPPGPWFAAADVIAVPSRWEGMALVPLEAMAAGRCVVMTDVAGVPPVLRSHGAVVRREDPAALSEALADRLLDDVRRRQEEVGNAAACEGCHDVSAVGEQVASVYREVLRERGSPGALEQRRHRS